MTNQPSTLTLTQFYETANAMRAQLNRVIVGQEDLIHDLIVTLLAGGNALLEGVPGLGKTLIIRTLAEILDCSFNRIQFTPDLMPADIVGTMIITLGDDGSRGFRFERGPIFANLVLADEINRASPRTQSALLEAMGEGQVSLDGVRRPLDSLFFVIATQNPIEFQGTYPLPEAQMDRFALRFSLGYVAASEEVQILDDQSTRHPLDGLEAVSNHDDIERLREAVRAIAIADELKRYVVDLIVATRETDGVLIGASPRASLAVMKCAQALALFDGEEFVTPEHVQEIAAPVIAHRLVMDPQARYSGHDADSIVAKVLDQVPVPI